MNMTRKERLLRDAQQAESHRVKLVKSHTRGWLTIGATSLALLGGLAIASNAPQTVSAESNAAANTNEESTTSVTAGTIGGTKEGTPVQWSVRPVADIKAQIASDNLSKGYYLIKWGDTLSTIAQALNESNITTSVDRLAEINSISNVDLIDTNAKLYFKGTGDDATVTTKSADGTSQTYNLNPSKGTVATEAEKATAQSQTDAAKAEAKNNAATTQNNATSTGNTATGTTTGNSGSTGGNGSTTTTPTNSNVSVTKNVDEAGTDLGNAVDTTKYTKVSTNTAGPIVTTDAAGNTITTTTTTNVYHKINMTNKTLTVNVDTNGNDLGAMVDTTQYTLQSSTSDTQTQTATNGDKTVTTTTTNTYSANTNTGNSGNGNSGTTTTPTNTNVSVTKNVDEAGNDLGATVDTRAYKLLETSAPSTVVTTDAATGNTTTTTTTTNTYHKIVTRNVAVTKNVDENGNTLSSTTGYVKVSQSASTVTTTAANGDITNTTTTTVVFRRSTATTKEVTINVDDAGTTLTGTVDTTRYKLISTSAPVSTTQTDAMGNTVTTLTTTKTWHKMVTINETKTVNVDEDGNVLSDTTGYTRSSSSTASHDTTAANGDTHHVTVTTVVWVLNTPSSTTNIGDAVIVAQGSVLETAMKADILNGTDTVSNDDAKSLVNIQFSKKVAAKFNALLNAEQTATGHTTTSLVDNDNAYDANDAKAIGVMYIFDHAAPDGFQSTGGSTGDYGMDFSTENLSKSYVSKSAVNGNEDTLVTLIAQAMYKQYIDDERNTNGGHYVNLVTRNYNRIAVGVYIVDTGSRYVVTTTVTTGNVTDPNFGGIWG